MATQHGRQGSRPLGATRANSLGALEGVKKSTSTGGSRTRGTDWWVTVLLAWHRGEAGVRALKCGIVREPRQHTKGEGMDLNPQPNLVFSVQKVLPAAEDWQKAK